MKKSRTVFLCLVLTGLLLMGCGKNPADETPQIVTDSEESANQDESNVLIAYFGRWGNTDFPDGIDASTSASIVIGKDNNLQGTTEYVASMIQEYTGGTLHLIQTADTYPADYDAVVDQNHQEQDEGSMPELSTVVENMDQYEIVFIGYPIWATTIPRPVISFIEQYDLSGKIIIPFCTHGGYGSGSSYTEIENLLPDSEILDGFAVEAEQIDSAEQELENWLDDLDVI